MRAMEDKKYKQISLREVVERYAGVQLGAITETETAQLRAKGLLLDIYKIKIRKGYTIVDPNLLHQTIQEYPAVTSAYDAAIRGERPLEDHSQKEKVYGPVCWSAKKSVEPDALKYCGDCGEVIKNLDKEICHLCEGEMS